MKKPLIIIVACGIAVIGLTGCSDSGMKGSDLFKQDNQKQVAVANNTKTSAPTTNPSKPTKPTPTPSPKPSNPTPTPSPKPSNPIPSPTPTPSKPVPTPTPTPTPAVKAGFDQGTTDMLNRQGGINDLGITNKVGFYQSLANMIANGSLSTGGAISQLAALQTWTDTCKPSPNGSALISVIDPQAYVVIVSKNDLETVLGAFFDLGTHNCNLDVYSAYRLSNGNWRIARVQSSLSWGIVVN